MDFIKANLWGAERNFLLGASNTIDKYKPKISICDCYNDGDRQVLEEILLSIDSNYVIEHKYQKMYAYYDLSAV